MNKITIGGHKMSEELVREYQMYMEKIRDIEYGTLYKVKLTLNNEGLKAGLMKKIKKAFKKRKSNSFFQHDEQTATLIMEVVHFDEGVHEIELTMDHTLNGDQYGSYTWECIML